MNEIMSKFDAGRSASVRRLNAENARDDAEPMPQFEAWSESDAVAFQQQESSIILLNLCVLTALLLTHEAFQEEVGPPSPTVVIAFAIRFGMQLIELAILRSRRWAFSPIFGRRYSVVSIWVNVAFALLVSVLATGEDTHYNVLMVIPIISSAFRFRLPGSLCVVAVAGCLTVLEVWLYFQGDASEGSFAEYFEAASMILVYVVVAIVVWLLTRILRREQRRLGDALSELEAAKDRLVVEEKLAAVGRLSGAIAHEIRNPVAMISSSLATARRSNVSPDMQEEMFAIATAEAARLERLTTDFLAYARSKPAEKRPTAACGTLQYVAELIKARAGDADVKIAFECNVDAPVEADEFQIHQALLNLAINAIEASPRGGRVWLRANTRYDGGVDYVVENEGDAIPTDVADRIFEPFVSTKPSGTGLGLAITRNIARAHGGDVLIDRNEDGRVRFVLRLPGRGNPS